MKKITFLLLAVLTGCTTTEYQGVPGNAFPRHQLNYLFSESFSLDYTTLKASEWRQLSQSANGAYASTELIPKSETANDWQKKITITYYPNVTTKRVSTLAKSVTYVRERLRNSCQEGRINWSIIENSEEYYSARVDNEQCEKIPNQSSIYRLLQTASGLNVLVYSQKANIDASEMVDLTNILKQAKVIGYTPKPLTHENEQKLSY